MATAIIQELIQALQEEIEAIKRGKGGSSVKIFNGKFLQEFSGLFVYVFNLEIFLAALEDTPAEIEIRGVRYPAQVLVTNGLEVEIGIEQFLGDFIAEATLQTNLWYLLELLKKKYDECLNGTLKIDFKLSDALFSGSPLTTNPLPAIVKCKRCGIKNKIKKHEPNKIPICGKCSLPINYQIKIQYSYSKDPPNETQKEAITESLTSPICIIWGPPGTGKTKTIAKAIEAHLNAGRRVLLVSHANNAVDEALLDVAEHLKDTPFYQEAKLIRLGKPQDEYLRKLESEYALVLPDRAASKLCESLIHERKELNNKKEKIENTITQLNAALQATQTVRMLESELEGLNTSISESNCKLTNAQEDLRRLEELQNQNREKLFEAERAGKIKKFIKRLDPKKIQSKIDKIQISIDSNARMLKEINNRLTQLISLRENTEKEVISAKKKSKKLLNSINVTPDQLEEKKRGLDSIKDSLLARIAEINHQLDDIQKKIISDAKLVATTLTKTFVSKLFPDNYFDVLVLDEASMAPLPHLYWASSRCNQFVTIVGDFLQLPPICISAEPMAQKWLGRNIFTILGIKNVTEACNDLRVKLLDTQYRMNPAIAAIPNRFFYQNKLKDHPRTFNHKINDGISELPLALINTAAANPWCSRLNTGGRFNLYHAVLSATLAKLITENNPNGGVGIVTPYTAQARLINKIVKDWNILDRVRVGTVHRFQGGEKQIIIFDSVEGEGTRVAPMLDDTKRNSDARLLLNVALTRAQSRFYFIGHINHLLSNLHTDSVLARLIHYLYENAEVKDSEVFVDKYFATDFDTLADELLSALTPARMPLSGDSYSEKNFWSQFINDLKTTRERLIIHSPFITVKRTGKFINYFQSLIKRGIEIRIHTWPSSRQQGNMIEQSEIVIKNLRGIGVKVIEGYHASRKHFKTAIIDNRILWDGSLNILSHKDTEEHMYRFEGTSAVEQIIRDLELDEDTATGNITNEICDKCGAPMVMRRSKYGAFLGCSKYPHCKNKKDLRSARTFNDQRSCPKCGSPMAIRRSAKGGAFWGCTGYPSCQHTARV